MGPSNMASNSENDMLTHMPMQSTQNAELLAKSGLAHAQNVLSTISELEKQDKEHATMPLNMTSGSEKVTTNSTTNNTTETKESHTEHSNLTLTLVSAKTFVNATESHGENATQSHDVNVTESHTVNATVNDTESHIVNATESHAVNATE